MKQAETRFLNLDKLYVTESSKELSKLTGCPLGLFIFSTIGGLVLGIFGLPSEMPLTAIMLIIYVFLYMPAIYFYSEFIIAEKKVGAYKKRYYAPLFGGIFLILNILAVLSMGLTGFSVHLANGEVAFNGYSFLCGGIYFVLSVACMAFVQQTSTKYFAEAYLWKSSHEKIAEEKKKEEDEEQDDGLRW